MHSPPRNFLSFIKNFGVGIEPTRTGQLLVAHHLPSLFLFSSNIIKTKVPKKIILKTKKENRYLQFFFQQNSTILWTYDFTVSRMNYPYKNGCESLEKQPDKM